MNVVKIRTNSDEVRTRILTIPRSAAEALMLEPDQQLYVWFTAKPSNEPRWMQMPACPETILVATEPELERGDQEPPHWSVPVWSRRRTASSTRSGVASFALRLPPWVKVGRLYKPVVDGRALRFEYVGEID